MMGKVTLSNTMTTGGMTSVTNIFIDQYMPDANDSQIKVYLYLLRMLQAGAPTSISDIADRFNDTEKDIMRALKYWEKKGLIGLEYDENGQMISVRLEDMPQEPVVRTASAPVNFQTARARGARRTSTAAEEKENSQLVFLAEQYYQRLLSKDDADKLYYIKDELGFSAELEDYLLQYCAEHDKSSKKSFKFVEKVALEWHSNNITTVAEAVSYVMHYDSSVYAVMRQLGMNSTPAPAEAAFISKWTGEMGFSMDIIGEACERTVLSTQKNRLQYADRILRSWYDSKVTSLEDVKKLDDDHKKAGNCGRSRNTRSMGRSDFMQNSYDFEQLEKELVKN
ncbi:DnaD domain protein [Butyrivibrio sp. MC2013]|uniref:DnaD domain protein n=1 Tax=Butyrivibrio sp. MC2013 TaxID=1280686 RepID=UPI000414DD46|nr:DnaD domain protein [Butyrivibrio sp. MC2013]